ncbi:hypothetical protein [Neobacillus sp. 114]|uniref:hypothetical protein n=1 Tax=Neobacillus sp. 114 TaxID=3048535 RepID=UPI0024C41F49|nr:hypothetical protein [Neobacillus sp. 114]
MKLFFGGTFVSYGMIVDDPHSFSYEWSGVIGGSLPYLYSSQWIIVVPVLFFIFTVISIAFINDSIKSYFQRKDHTFKSRG